MNRTGVLTKKTTYRDKGHCKKDRKTEEQTKTALAQAMGLHQKLTQGRGELSQDL